VAGLYFHIPFCRKACRYCDFHFSVSLAQKTELLKAMLIEIEQSQNNYVKQNVDSIYFGGGTPSVLNENEISTLLEAAYKIFSISDSVEFSFEANPDDLKPDYISLLKNLGVNRLSIGIQSFRDVDLQLMRRSHNSIQAVEAVQYAQTRGIDNISIDLIYGFPGLSNSDWEENIKKALNLKIPHISAYHLTFEPGTIFDHWRKKGRIFPMDEEESLRQFEMLKLMLEENGFLHYEISNFGKPKFFSKHNSNYWKQIPYIGIGPSAHSYDGNERKWNISSNNKYIEYLQKSGSNYFEKEILTTKDKYNEYMLTGLRTMWGIDLIQIEQRFGNNYVKYTKNIADKYFSDELIFFEDKFKLSKRGIFLADFIIEKFFLEENIL
jgi:putative oxygen-independent coproporphyrinogen III oxidase